MNKPVPDYVQEWIDGDYAKVVVRCPNLIELLRIRDIAVERNIPHALITDNGSTVFKEPTITCLSVGPYYSKELDKLLGGGFGLM
jgi:peptidyl-tRNA hydrolase